MSLSDSDMSLLFEGFRKCHDAESKQAIEWQDNADKQIQQLYSTAIKKYILPLLQDTKPDRHKRASVLEMSIMATLPIVIDDQAIRSQLNAEFAMTAAKAIILQYWYPVDLDKEILRLEAFERAHICWLMHLSPESYPFISNAISWYLFEQLIGERYTRQRGHPLEGNPLFI